MIDVLALIEQARASKDLSSLVQAIPYAQFLGLDVEVIDDALVTRLEARPENIGNAALPALHGGTIGALLESSAIFEVLWQVPSATLPRIVTLTVDYLRSGAPKPTWARSSITRRGRRVVSVRAEAWQDDSSQPIATANAHLLVVDDGNREGGGLGSPTSDHSA